MGTTRKLGSSLIAMALLLAAGARAEATQFVITIKNTSNSAWSAGLITLSPLITVGDVPSSSAPEYAAYAFAAGSCVLSDELCSTGACEDGDASVLAQRRGLTLGTDAWLVPPLAVGAVARVAIDATVATSPTPQPRVSFIARAGNGDDFVAIHRAGDAATLSSSALFTSAGMPVMNVDFELGGYNANASDSLDGSAGACAPSCGGASPGCYVASGNGSIGASLEAQPTLPALSNPWTFAAPANYSSDGLALGPVAGAGSSGNALVVILNGLGFAGTWNDNGTGRAVVLSSLSSESPSEYAFDATTAGHDFMGFPTIQNLTSPDVPASGLGQFIVQEFADVSQTPGASVHARNSDSAEAQWTLYGLGYPGLWNMGSSAGELRTDDPNSGEEMVIPTWSGALVLAKRDTAETLNSFDFYAQYPGETLYGHVAVADVHPTAGNEMVLFGGTTGTVYVMGVPESGSSLVPLWTSTPPAGLYAYGSGPSIADLDGDGQPEIIVASADSNKIYAYDPSYGSGCKYQWTIPGSSGYALSSPVTGDVDGDGGKDVVVFSSNSLLSVLGVLAVPTDGVTCADGAVKWSYTVGNGGPSWFVPALADLTGNGALDIVVANYSTLEVVDAQAQQVAFRFSDPSATFFPSAVVEARSGGTGAAAAIYTSGWSNGKVYRLTTPSDATVPASDWPGFMGSNSRTGAR
jgi:hypothetical protein